MEVNYILWQQMTGIDPSTAGHSSGHDGVVCRLEETRMARIKSAAAVRTIAVPVGLPR